MNAISPDQATKAARCRMVDAYETPRLPSHVLRHPAGFTILEIILVLFLLTGLLSFIIPRLNIGDSLSSVGRKWIAALRTFQDMSVSSQRIVRVYIDLDRGHYWPLILQDTDEKPPLDPSWLTPVTFPETIRLTDLQVRGKTTRGGRADLFFYPNGKMDPAIMHFADPENNILGVRIEPVTAEITVTDQRIELPPPWTMPERLRPLLLIQAPIPGSPGSRPIAPSGTP